MCRYKLSEMDTCEVLGNSHVLLPLHQRQSCPCTDLRSMHAVHIELRKEDTLSASGQSVCVKVSKNGSHKGFLTKPV